MLLEKEESLRNREKRLKIEIGCYKKLVYLLLI